MLPPDHPPPSSTPLTEKATNAQSTPSNDPTSVAKPSPLPTPTSVPKKKRTKNKLASEKRVHSVQAAMTSETPTPGAAPASKKARTSMPGLNLSSLTTPSAATPVPSLPGFGSLPPPPPPSSNGSEPRRRSSVGVTRLSLPEPTEGAAGAGASKWDLFYDTDNQPYYLHADSGVSRWGYAKDAKWMEVEDVDTGCVYLEHATTGDTKWKTGESTVWEELKDPVTGEHYFYCNEDEDSQWTRPKWIDYICQDTGCIYYCDSAGNSQWSRPAEFVSCVAGAGTAAGKVRAALAAPTGDVTPGAAQGTPAPMATPRDLPMATPRQVAQPPVPSMGGRSPAPGSASKRGSNEAVAIAYSMAKRPKTAPPKPGGEEVVKLDVDSASG